MSFLTCFTFCILIVIIVFKLYIKLTTGWCKSNVCLVGKTVVVTGANGGIGYESAEDFAKRGARVILACRDEGRGNDAVQRIIRATDNQNVVFKSLDLSSFKSVRDFAKDINQTEERLDILLNNAGALGLGSKKNEDGLLLVMVTNYFGPFLLTNLLLDLLKKTSNSRIVNVASRAAERPLAVFDVNNLNYFPEGVSFADWKVYSRSKLCNILFTIELAARLRGTGVTTYSLHPGVIASELFRGIPQWTQILLYYVNGWFLKNNLEGAQTSIHCSVAKGIESFSGEYFVDCQFKSKYKTAEDPDLPKQLWKISEDLVKLNKQ